LIETVWNTAEKTNRRRLAFWQKTVFNPVSVISSDYFRISGFIMC